MFEIKVLGGDQDLVFTFSNPALKSAMYNFNVKLATPILKSIWLFLRVYRELETRVARAGVHSCPRLVTTTTSSLLLFLQ